MRRLIKWFGGTVGGSAAFRFVRRQEASLQAAPEVAVDESDARADELRAKLAESRAAEPVTEKETAPEEEEEEREAEEERETEEEQPAPEPESPEDRRRRVHEEGRAALDEMRSD
jgi:hypothetical protein